MVLLDSVEKLHVIDRQTQEELETVEISEVQLVYNSSHFKSLATGGNVSQALVRIVPLIRSSWNRTFENLLPVS